MWWRLGIISGSGGVMKNNGGVEEDDRGAYRDNEGFTGVESVINDEKSIDIKTKRTETIYGGEGLS